MHWSGTDDKDGSEIQSYDLWVSEDGGPYQPWLGGTTDLTASYTGTAGKTYRFYSIARDGAGNVEEAPVTADAVTLIAAGPALTSLDPDSKPAGSGKFTLTLLGSGFKKGAVVHWGRKALAGTKFVSAAALKVDVPKADVATARPVSVTVTDPAPDNTPSNALTFTVSPPVKPHLTLTSVTDPKRTGTTVTLTAHVTNDGTANAARGIFTAVQLGTRKTSTRLPKTLGLVVVGAEKAVTLSFSKPGPKGKKVILRVSGVFSGGRFSGTHTVTLP